MNRKQKREISQEMNKRKRESVHEIKSSEKVRRNLFEPQSKSCRIRAGTTLHTVSRTVQSDYHQVLVDPARFMQQMWSGKITVRC